MNLRVLQKEETRARILESAIELFLRSDTGEVSIKDVGERAGVSTPSVFFHFGTRVDLLKAVGEELLQQAEARLPAPGSVRGTLEALEGITHAGDDDVTTALWRIGDELSWQEPGSTAFAAARLEQWIRSLLLADGYGEEDAEALTAVIGPAFLMVDRRLRVDKAPEEYAQAFVRGLRYVLGDARITKRPARPTGATNGSRL